MRATPNACYRVVSLLSANIFVHTEQYQILIFLTMFLLGFTQRNDSQHCNLRHQNRAQNCEQFFQL